MLLSYYSCSKPTIFLTKVTAEKKVTMFTNVGSCIMGDHGDD